MRTALVVLLIGFSTLGVHSQEIDIDRLGKEGKAAFQCAILAAEGTETYQAKASDLARSGHDKTEQAMTVVLSMMQADMSNGPLGKYVAEQDESFMVAMGFSDAVSQVTKFLDGKAPFDGTPYELVRKIRSQAADTEFEHRNCDFLIR